MFIQNDNLIFTSAPAERNYTEIIQNDIIQNDFFPGPRGEKLSPASVQIKVIKAIDLNHILFANNHADTNHADGVNLKAVVVEATVVVGKNYKKR